MIEVNFFLFSEHIATIPMRFRVDRGDTILVNNVLYEVIEAQSLSIKKYNDNCSFEQTVALKIVF